MKRERRRTTAEILGDALHHLRLVSRYATRDLDDQVTIDAICMRLSAAIETLERLEPDSRRALFGSDWSAMWGMRNRIAHGYMLVNGDVIRATVREDVPVLIGSIEAHLRSA